MSDYTSEKQPVAGKSLVRQSPMAAMIGQENMRLMFDKLRRSYELRAADDIAGWRNAITWATSPTDPNRRPLLAIYREAMRDAHLASAIMLRREKLLSQPYRVVDAEGIEDVELTRQMDSPAVHRMIRFVQESVFYGHSLVELWLGPDGTPLRCELLPREHVKPEAGEYLPDLTKPGEAIAYRKRAATAKTLLIEVGEPYGLGLLEQASRAELFKSAMVEAWAEFGEVFGLPTRHVKFMGNMSEAEKQKIVDNLQGAGMNAVTSGDESMELQFLEHKNTDSYQVFKEFIVYQDEKVSQMILGQTLTQASGEKGSRALGEVHERVSNYLTDADKRLVEEQLNAQLLPVLEQRSDRWKGRKLRYRKFESMSQLDRVSMAKTLFEMGYRWQQAELEAELGLNVERIEAPSAGTPSTEA
jgi:hypothetical protein